MIPIRQYTRLVKQTHNYVAGKEQEWNKLQTVGRGNMHDTQTFIPVTVFRKKTKNNSISSLDSLYLLCQNLILVIWSFIFSCPNNAAQHVCHPWCGLNPSRSIEAFAALHWGMGEASALQDSTTATSNICDGYSAGMHPACFSTSENCAALFSKWSPFFCLCYYVRCCIYWCEMKPWIFP